jgi:acetyltransferase
VKVTIETESEQLTRMFRPRGVAIIGASEQPYSLGTRYLGGLLRHKFPGGVYPVNPKYETVMGLKCYPSVLDIPGDVDTAVLSVSHAKVPQVLRECAEKRLAGVIVFAAGYAETGPEGAQKERDLADLAKELGIRFIGPNSPGFINFMDRASVTATSVQFREVLPQAGRLGVVAQSGGVAGIIAERAMDRGLGLSYMLCSGNEADFDTPEAIEYLAADENTDSIAVYQEGVNDAGRLMRAWAAASAAGKPVVTFIPGASKASQRAAAAHTGSLAGDDALIDGFARQFGVIRVGDLDEMLEVATALPKLPKGRNYENILILTTSGGGSVIAADALGRVGMDLPELAPEIQQSLAKEFHDFAVFHNPVDMTSDFVQNPPLFRKSIELVCQSSDHDVVVLILTVQRPDFARTLSDMILDSPEAHSGELVVLWYAGAMSDAARTYLRESGVTLVETPRTLAATLTAAKIWNKRTLEFSPAVEPKDVLIVPANSGELFDILERNGVAVAGNTLLADPSELSAAAGATPGPWVLKSASSTLGRKSDVGGVRLGLTDEAELAEAFESVRESLAETDAKSDPLLLQTMVPIGFELLLSVKRDPTFGFAIVLGVGGRMVELHKAVVVRRPPLTGSDIGMALEQLGLTPLVSGFRDLPLLDVDELAELSNALVEAARELLEKDGILEVNPLVLRSDGGGLVCVDVRVENGPQS